jgi:hypothetical protein
MDDDGFMALTDGRDPGTGERLKRVGGRAKVAAFHLTFSAPKSVSVLFAIGEPSLSGALVEAHESAVDAALGYLEREARLLEHAGEDVEADPHLLAIALAVGPAEPRGDILAHGGAKSRRAGSRASRAITSAPAGRAWRAARRPGTSSAR